MNVKIANRLNGIGEYYFSKKLQEIELLNKTSPAVINLGIGSPDLAPDNAVIHCLQHNASLNNTHAYQPYKGLPALKSAITNWYASHYNVSLNTNQVLPLIGSKEGIMHICMTYLNQGDKVLIPNPGYPTYSSAVKLAGGIPVYFDLTESLNWQPDFDALEKMDLSNVKMMWINYPNMPTGQNASYELFEKIIQFGIKHQILICHDNPYSFILNDTPLSILSVPNALDIAIELNSLSKSHNMAGWRVGMICASEERINEIICFKSNMDSGMFMPIQLAAIEALKLGKNWFNTLNNIYFKRRILAFKLLDILKCTYSTNQVGLFVWAKIPPNFTDGFALSDYILQNFRVFITPGGIFGDNGNNYIRVSLCCTEEKFNEAINKIIV